MHRNNSKTMMQVTATTDICPVGEITGRKNMNQAKIPVLSCEGACIRGEIARLAANIVSKGENFGRGCHGELMTVPNSAIARWIATAEKVILIDGCFLRCHGRILENIIDARKLVQFDALSHYRKYSDIFDFDDVPEDERKEVARSVAAWVLESLDSVSGRKASEASVPEAPHSSCCG